MGELFVIGGLTLCTDVKAADWVVKRVRDFEYDVGSLVPPGFAGYARVFHPAYRHHGEGEREVGWGEVAAANGRRVHPAMQWSSITGSLRFLHEDTQPGLWDREPSEGSLPIRQAARLAELLSGHTAKRGRC